MRKYLGNYENQRDASTSKHALPSSLRQKGLASPRLDGPVREGYANVVEASTSDLGKNLARSAFFHKHYTINVTRSDIQ